MAVLSTSSSDVSVLIDVASLTFGRTGDEPSLAACVSEDVDKDGIKDLICHFRTEKTAFVCGDTQGILKGKTADGTPVIGKDKVTIVSCKK